MISTKSIANLISRTKKDMSITIVDVHNLIRESGLEYCGPDVVTDETARLLLRAAGISEAVGPATVSLKTVGDTAPTVRENHTPSKGANIMLARQTDYCTDPVKIKQIAQTEWDAETALRSEFKSFENYLAFRTGELTGGIKQLGAQNV